MKDYLMCSCWYRFIYKNGYFLCEQIVYFQGNQFRIWDIKADNCILIKWIRVILEQFK